MDLSIFMRPFLLWIQICIISARLLLRLADVQPTSSGKATYVPKLQASHKSIDDKIHKTTSVVCALSRRMPIIVLEDYCQ